MKKPENQPPIEHVVWNFLSSVRLTLVILIILAGVSILGTLVPGLFDLYRSFWFRALISLLALNLIVCSLNRLGPTLRVFKSAPRPDRLKPFEEVPPEQSFESDLSAQDAASKAEGLFSKKYDKFARSDSGSDIFMIGERGKYSLFGVYIVHLSVLLILIGAIVGSIWGFQAFVNIPEGETVNVVRLRNGHAHRELGFSVECVKFSIDFWENGRTPKEYRSDLRFRDGTLEKDVLLRVNHPFTFNGITFYQSSYGSFPGNDVDLLIRREGFENGDTVVRAVRGKEMPLPHDDGFFVVDEIRADFMRMGLGPAVRISVRPDEEHDPFSFWVFLHLDRARAMLADDLRAFPGLNPSAYEPYTFFVRDMESRYFTGLQVNKDPGVPFVWAGFFLMVGGMCVTLFMSHRRIRIRIINTQGGSMVSVVGRANKNQASLQREINELISRLKGLFEGQEGPS